MSTKQRIVTYEIGVGFSLSDLPDGGNNRMRLALSTLLIGAGQRILDGDDAPLLPARLTLDLETDHWDHKFVLVIEKVKDD